MLKHNEHWDARLASIDTSLMVIARCCAFLMDRGLLEKFVESLPDAEASERGNRPTESMAVEEKKEHYEESELMTIKEAEDYFGRTKLYELRKAGMLTTVAFHARDKRLVRAEVVALARWRRR